MLPNPSHITGLKLLTKNLAPIDKELTRNELRRIMIMGQNLKGAFLLLGMQAAQSIIMYSNAGLSGFAIPIGNSQLRVFQMFGAPCVLNQSMRSGVFYAVPVISLEGLTNSECYEAPTPTLIL